MSYIRCLSNPEGLYIYASDNKVVFTWCHEPPLSSGREDMMMVPHKAFRAGIKDWHDNFGQPVDIDGFSIKEEYIYMDTGELVPKNRDLLEMLDDPRKSERQIKISYGSMFVFMWRVTWEYVVANHLSREQ